MENFTPTSARKNFYSILKQINDQKKPVRINSTRRQDVDAVIVSADDWDAIQETLYLESTGTLNKVRERENDGLGSTNIKDIDWDEL